jgi:hypothetical protein
MKSVEVIPEKDIQLPDSTAFPDLKILALAACKTLNVLEQAGLEVGDPGPKDDLIASKLVEEYAENSKKKLSYKQLAELRPESIIRTAEIVKRFDYAVVKKANQLRFLVVNKLILETENANPTIRIRALEMIGKMTDVGLFTERKEVVVTNKTAEEVRDKLKDKLSKMRTLVKNSDGVYEDAPEPQEEDDPLKGAPELELESATIDGEAEQVLE